MGRRSAAMRLGCGAPPRAARGHGAGRLFTVGLILTVLGIVFYAAASLVEFVLEGRLRAVLGRRAMKRVIDALRDHVILCGYGRFGRSVAEELERGNVRIVVVDREASLQPDLEAANRLYVWARRSTNRSSRRLE
jgi:voltage-gated potassium channel